MFSKSKIVKYEEYEFSKGDEFSDMKLIVEDKIIFIHRAILATVSPVFKKMFTSDFKEKLFSEINLPNKKFDDIIEMLNTIYPHKTHEIDESKLEILLELSEEYDIMKLKILIENKIIEKLNKGKVSQTKLYGKAIDYQLDNVMYSFELSNRYRLKKLKTECINNLAKNSFNENSIEKHEFYSKIEDSDKIEILSKKLASCEEKLSSRDKRIKLLEDENMKQKFEIMRLKSEESN